MVHVTPNSFAAITRRGKGGKGGLINLSPQIHRERSQLRKLLESFGTSELLRVLCHPEVRKKKNVEETNLVCKEWKNTKDSNKATETRRRNSNKILVHH